MGDATKCERCGQVMYVYGDVDVDDCVDSGGSACLERVVARLTAEVATLRAKLDDAEARWEEAERMVRQGAFLCTAKHPHKADGWCERHADWSPADREYRCTEHTTREGAEETKR